MQSTFHFFFRKSFLVESDKNGSRNGKNKFSLPAFRLSQQLLRFRLCKQLKYTSFFGLGKKWWPVTKSKWRKNNRNNKKREKKALIWKGTRKIFKLVTAFEKRGQNVGKLTAKKASIFHSTGHIASLLYLKKWRKKGWRKRKIMKMNRSKNKISMKNEYLYSFIFFHFTELEWM